MMVNLLRSFLALTGFGLVSFTFTFWSHHQWEQVLPQHEGNRHYPLRSNGHETLSHPSLQVPVFSATTSRAQLSDSKIEHHEDNNNDIPILHIVYTRFMQHQPNLTALGLARLELLKEFFLQSLQGQTTHNFLVVIRTDPQLNDVIQQPLLTLFPNATDSPYPFRYLVIGSNTNPQSHQYAHLLQQFQPTKDVDGTDEKDAIWSGTIQAAKDYLLTNSNGTRIILETRLDSDDGLHTEYLEQLQHQARDTLQKAITTTTTATTTKDSTTGTGTGTGTWRMWCANKYLEWQYMAPWDLKHSHAKHKNDKEKRNEQAHSMDGSGSSELGALIVSRFWGCLSAGITLAYRLPPSTEPQPSMKEYTDIELPSLQRHEKLAKTIPHCEEESNKPQQHHHSPSTNCLTIIKLHPSVVRARTPTSAGMLNIFWDWGSSTGGKSDNNLHQLNSHNQQEQLKDSQVEVTKIYRQYQKLALQQQPFQEKLWLLVPNVFGMTPPRIQILRDYLTRNMADIAKDNLMGQCSTGHSCKDSSQVMLRKIAAET